MTKKDYILITEAINDARMDNASRKSVVAELGIKLAKQNPRFNYDNFKRACGDRKESYTDYLRRVADDFEEGGMHATAKDYRESAQRIDSLVDKLNRMSKVFAALHPDTCNSNDAFVTAREELERYGK